MMNHKNMSTIGIRSAIISLIEGNEEKQVPKSKVLSTMYLEHGFEFEETSRILKELKDDGMILIQRNLVILNGNLKPDPQKLKTMFTNTVLPVTPTEASNKRLASFEPEIIQAVNNMIVANLGSSRKYADFKQKDVAIEYCKLKGIDFTETVYNDLGKRHQFDFEDVFKKAGWKVSYNRADYTESWYEPYFSFSKNDKEF